VLLQKKYKILLWLLNLYLHPSRVPFSYPKMPIIGCVFWTKTMASNLWFVNSSSLLLSTTTFTLHNTAKGWLEWIEPQGHTILVLFTPKITLVSYLHAHNRFFHELAQIEWYTLSNNNFFSWYTNRNTQHSKRHLSIRPVWTILLPFPNSRLFNLEA